MEEVKRECGSCSWCCTYVKVEEGDFFKEAGVPCQYLNEDGHGCSIFGKPERPKICSTFKCAWLAGIGNEEDKPTESGVFLHINTFNGGTWIFAIETKTDAYLTTGRNIIIDITKKVDMPIIVSDFNSKPGTDYGDYVIIKEKLESRSNQIKGEFICELEKGINAYKLIISE